MPTDPHILTYSGLCLRLLQPDQAQIRLVDIAHALARICRFGGHVHAERYSVAQHSVLVSYMVPPRDALWGLLHDGSEAYLGDVVADLKHSPAMAGYRALEGLWQLAVYERFGLCGPEPDSVHEADLLLRQIEMEALMAPCPTRPALPAGARAIKVHPWTVDAAEGKFRQRFGELRVSVR